MKPTLGAAVAIHVSEEKQSKLIDQVLLSGDEKTLLSSFYGHHVAVFNIESKRHTHTLTNQHSMLLLHQAKITYRGCHLVHTNYDDDSKVSYITVWNLIDGKVTRRLKNEPMVCALDISKDASTVIFATEDNFLKIWKPFKRSGHQKIQGYNGLRMRGKYNDCQGTTIYLTSNEKRAILFSYDISLWDIEEECVLARFTPDVPFQCCTVAMNGDLIIAGMRNTATAVTLRLLSRNCGVTRYGRAVLGDKVGVFGEKTEKDSESSEDEMIDE